MVKILSKYKRTEFQWMRIASYLETLYLDMHTNETRDNFFSSQMPMSLDELNSAEEYWKTNHIFMTDKQTKQFKKSLEYYKYNEDEDNNNNNNNKIEKMMRKEKDSVNDTLPSNNTNTL